MEKNENVIDATVKASGEQIKVYKLKREKEDDEEIFNRFLGNDITLEKVENGLHTQQFKRNELTF